LTRPDTVFVCWFGEHVILEYVTRDYVFAHFSPNLANFSNKLHLFIRPLPMSTKRRRVSDK